MGDMQITNKVFAETDKRFREDCKKAVPEAQPTKRQASKYRLKTGRVYKEVSK